MLYKGYYIQILEWGKWCLLSSYAWSAKKVKYIALFWLTDWGSPCYCAGGSTASIALDLAKFEIDLRKRYRKYYEN
jgi:hypothetical protein